MSGLRSEAGDYGDIKGLKYHLAHVINNAGIAGCGLLQLRNLLGKYPVVDGDKKTLKELFDTYRGEGLRALRNRVNGLPEKEVVAIARALMESVGEVTELSQECP